MTTAFIIASARVSDNNTFRKACVDYSSLLSGMGLVQTEDSGQIDLEAVVKPSSTNSVAGFQVWRFNDALQSVAPIFIKVLYGTGNVEGFRVWVELGTASDGGGGLAGLVTGSYVAGNTTTTPSGVRDTWHISGCHTDGFAGVAGVDPSDLGTSGGIGSFVICRTCDSDGVATPEGASLLLQNGPLSGTPSAVSVRFSTPSAIVFAGNSALSTYLLNPHSLSTTVDGELPSYLAFHAIPQIIPMHGVCGVLANVMSPRDTFEVAMVGNAPRRYMIPGPNAIVYSGSTSGVGFASLAMLWE